MILTSIEDFILKNAPNSRNYAEQYIRAYNYCKFLNQRVTIEMVYPKETALIKNVEYFYDKDDEGNEYEYLQAPSGDMYYYRKLPDGKWFNDNNADLNYHLDECGIIEIEDSKMEEILNKPIDL